MKRLMWWPVSFVYWGSWLCLGSKLACTQPKAAHGERGGQTLGGDAVPGVGAARWAHDGAVGKAHGKDLCGCGAVRGL